MREFIPPLPEHFTVVDDFGDWTNYYTADQMDDHARDAALLVLDAVCALLPADPVYMDPPDGGNVSVLEQVARMAEDAAKWRASQAAADPVVEANRKLLLDRSNVGIDKYGTTLEDAKLAAPALVQHALEETLDLANYLQALLRKLP